MKHFLPFIISLFVHVALAQPVMSLQPNPVNKTFAVDLTDPTLDLELHATLKNETAQEIRLKWTRVVKNAPLDWDTQVCDNNFCYLPHINTNIDAALGLNEPVVLAPGESFNLIFHVLPNSTPGEGAFELVFALASAPNTPIDTAFYTIPVSAITTSARFDVRKSDIRVFPNPATDYFELTNSAGVDQLVIYNLLGRQVRNYRVNGGQLYNVSDLPDGLYLVSMVSNRQGIVRTVRLNKRSWRP